jgi:GMP synthase (glutamine-hydrolysing)
MKEHEKIAILDFGSQYSQLIARRVRENYVFSTIVRHDITLEELNRLSPKGVVLSGGPHSVYEQNSPHVDPEILKSRYPVLGICYGMQLMAHHLGGKVEGSTKREYGRAELQVSANVPLFNHLKETEVVWMSHGDKVIRLPEGFASAAVTDNSLYAAIRDTSGKKYGLQFHPEVVHTPNGNQILRNFIYDVCGCKGDWTMGSFLEESVERIRARVNGNKVILALSGGVDSSVTALLLHKAIGENLHCVFVNNGLLRKNEEEEVKNRFAKHFGIHLTTIDASNRFHAKLKGVEDPERKRKIIGEEFIRVFEETAKQIGDVKYLAQGTLYPDVIESVSAKGGPSATIKTHHNVGGLPEKMNLELIEPMRDLFKDEVRALGIEMGMSEEIVWRHPFPGPGLAVRIIGDVTEDRLALLREADAIYMEEIRKAGLYRQIAQAFVVLLPVKSVGVMGDGRTYENVAALRAVTTNDFMTADWYRFPPEVLGRISNRIINEVRGINRVVYDVSSKPPSTIEWE